MGCGEVKRRRSSPGTSCTASSNWTNGLFPFRFFELVPAVKIHDLPEQRDLLRRPRATRPAHFPYDFGNRARPLGPPPRRGHDAERAVHVAALHDRDESRGLPIAQRMLANEGLLRRGLLVGIDDRRAPLVSNCRGKLPPSQQFVHVVGHAMEFLRADDEIDRHGQLFGQLRAAALRHAAHQSKWGRLAAQLLQASPFCRSLFARGHVAHAAGLSAG